MSGSDGSRRWAFEREDEDERLARVLDEEARDRLGLEEADRLLERADAPDERPFDTPLGARQRAQTQRDVADILQFGAPRNGADDA